jgi:hypothetical protein
MAAHWDMPADWLEGPPRDATGRDIEAGPPAAPPELVDTARRLRERDRRAGVQPAAAGAVDATPRPSAAPPVALAPVGG